MSNAPASPLLCYVDDRQPGITRRSLRHGWAYFAPDGMRLRDRDEIDRLNAIGMPPAYSDCWFCPSPQGHILATGFDARRRKQYRYHPDFRAAQDSDKFDRCAAFGRGLPALRAKVADDLAGRGLARDTVIAAVVRLLDLGRVRIGNESYVKQNKSYGATTLRRRHAQISRQSIKLQFRAKSGKTQRLTIADQRLATLTRRCQDLPGQHLFQYLDDSGAPHPLGSSEVNDYLRQAMANDFTAKHFRTWAASLVAFETLIAAQGPISVKQLVQPVSEILGNTPAIARKSYIHPALIEVALNGEPLKELKLPRATKYLSRAERGLIAWLDAITLEKTIEAA